MKRLDYDDMERGQFCLIYINDRRGRKTVDVGRVTECHGIDYDDYEDFSMDLIDRVIAYDDYENFSMDLIDGDPTVYRYYNEDDQGADNYNILLYVLDYEEFEQHILMETI